MTDLLTVKQFWFAFRDRASVLDTRYPIIIWKTGPPPLAQIILRMKLQTADPVKHKMAHYYCWMFSFETRNSSGLSKLRIKDI